MGILLKNADLITDQTRSVQDLRIVEEVIGEVGQNLVPHHDDEIIDAAGMLVIPGGIDPHTHLDLKVMGTVTKDDFASGTKAAAVGGTTTIIDFATPERDQSLLTALDLWRAKADGRAVIDYGLHMAVPRWNERIGTEMETVVDRGVSSFKIFLAYKGTLAVDDTAMYRVMGRAKELGALVMVHAENAEIVWHRQRELLAAGKNAPIDHARSRPPAVEADGTHRAITMARIHDMPLYIVHLSSFDALRCIGDAALSGVDVRVETCPQYLLLDEREYQRPNWEGAKWVMSPPLRTADHRAALWAGIRGGLIGHIGTDHCSFDFVGQKDLYGKDDFTRIPNGIPGIQDRLALIYTYGVLAGSIDLQRWVALCATNPARTFGLYPRKGTLQVGSDADIVLWDPTWEGVLSAKTHLCRNDYHAFEGFSVRGRPHLVLSRGKVIGQDGQFVGAAGAGRFLHRKGL